jgi:hypothetical protein
MGKKKIVKKSPPTPYGTMPWYYPTEQVDIVRKLKIGKAKIRKRRKN